MGKSHFFLIMPVTKTAKRALRGSINKENVNKLIISKLEAAVRAAKRAKSSVTIIKAVSLADRAAKKNVIHKNKAARIKSQLSKLGPKATKSAPVAKPASKAKKSVKKASKK